MTERERGDRIARKEATELRIEIAFPAAGCGVGDLDIQSKPHPAYFSGNFMCYVVW